MDYLTNHYLGIQFGMRDTQQIKIGPMFSVCVIENILLASQSYVQLRQVYYAHNGIIFLFIDPTYHFHLA